MICPGKRRPSGPPRPRPDAHRPRRARFGRIGRGCHDNALAESFVDSFKAELVSDRVWRCRSQLELAFVEYVGWFSTSRLREALGDSRPAELEALDGARYVPTSSLS
jgi:transposase InsO family protein